MDNTIPIGIPDCEIGTNMKTVELIIWLTRAIYRTGKEVITDSGFYILKGLLEMSNMGVYGSELIKEIRYCPMEVHRYVINEYFSTKKIGDVICLSG